MKQFFLALSIVVLGVLATTHSHAQQNFKYEMSWGHDTNASEGSEGFWSFGGRPIEAITLDAGSEGGKSKTLEGTLRYSASNHLLKLKLTRAGGNQFTAEAKLGNENWRSVGTWTVGHRTDHAVIKVDLKGANSGRTVSGTMTYEGEGIIHVKGNAK